MECFARTPLPLCVHMGMSYPPFQDLCRSYHANMIAKALPAEPPLSWPSVGNKMLWI